MLVVGRHEDHVGRGLQAVEQVEAGPLGHLDVQEHDVGRRAGGGQPGQERLGLVGVGGLADDLDGVVGEQRRQLAAGQTLVVDEDGAERAVRHGRRGRG